MELENAGDIDVFPGNSVIVIHPGSLHLRIGKASDPFPHTLPHCIAWRKTQQGSPGRLQSWLHKKEVHQGPGGNDKQRKAAAKKAQEALCSIPTSTGECRPATSYKELARLNSVMKPECSEVMSPLQWTNLDHQPQFVIGEDALYLHPASSYDLHWPYQYGDLNIHNGFGLTPTAVLHDLEVIWSIAIETFLDIQRKDFERFKVILLVPDVFKRTNVRMLVDLVLNQLGFSAIVVMLESVCASFGAALSSACVVDVGDQKTSICCVEDGMSVRQSRITLNYGGCDVTRCFHWLLDRIGYPHDCSDASWAAADRPLTALLLQELKHTYCHLSQDNMGIDDLFVQVRPPGQCITKYTMKVGDERILAPLAVFYPEMFDLSAEQARTLTRLAKVEVSDPSDPFDDAYIAQTRAARSDEPSKAAGGRKKGGAAQLNESQDLVEGEANQVQGDEDMLDAYEEGGHSTPAIGAASATAGAAAAVGAGSGLSSGCQTSEALRDDQSQRISEDKLMSLDQAILFSIDQCETDEMKLRMYSCIVLVGGGLMFDGATESLQYKLLTHMPAQYRIGLESMDVITRPKDLDPQIVCWKGGALTSFLGPTQEMWIKPGEWQQYGVKVLRERGSFTW